MSALLYPNLFSDRIPPYTVQMRITIEGVAIEYDVYRPTSVTAPSLVLLHEGLGSLGLWKDFPQVLARAAGREVLVYSRQGHGHSDRLDHPRRPDFMHREAQVLRKLLVECGRTDALPVGHSDGGSIALLYASAFDVPAVITLAPHVFVEQLSLTSIRATKERFARTDLGERMRKYHSDPHHTFFAWNDIWLSPEFAEWTIESETRKITSPLLVIQGRNDEYGSAAQYETIARAAPQTDVVVLGQCGHSPHRDRPEATLGAITGFLAAL